MTRLTPRRSRWVTWAVPYLLLAVASVWRWQVDELQQVHDHRLLIGGVLLLAVLIFIHLRWHGAVYTTEVFDAGSHLDVRRGAERELVPIGNVRAVDTNTVGWITVIELELRTPCRFGARFAFVPAQRATWAGVNVVEHELRARIGATTAVNRPVGNIVPAG